MDANPGPDGGKVMALVRSSAPDRYRSFAELARGERTGENYQILVEPRLGSKVAIVAPHAGWIEPGTSEIARAVAGNDLNLYLFEGMRRRPHADLHIASDRFDEPRCLALLEPCDTVIAIHGCRDDRPHDILIGGRDLDRRRMVSTALQLDGWDVAEVLSGYLSAMSASNICNRGATRKGVQIEIKAGLRRRLTVRSDDMLRFAQAIRSSIL